MVTIRAVADHAGVSVGTVSNVLNRPSYVTPATRDRVLAAIDELGFVPTQHRRQFRPGRERVLGCVMVDLGNPFFVDVALAIEEAAAKRGAGVVICHSGESPQHEEHNLDVLIQLRVHGILVAPVEEENPRLDELRQKGVPLVFLDRLDPRQEISTVTVDQIAGGRLAAEHLLRLGHRKLAFVSGPDTSHLVRDRLSGFRAAGADWGIDPDAVQVLEGGTWTDPNGGDYAGTSFLALKEHTRPTAVFCANDTLARGFIRRLQAEGLRVPRDVSVVGYDDVEWAVDLPVPLTTVRQPRAELGWRATDLIMAAIDDPSAPTERVILQPELVVRETTSAVGQADAPPSTGSTTPVT